MNRVLLINAQFPPDPAVGGMRPAAFARHLPQFGWEACVVARRLRDGDNGSTEPGARRVERAWGGDSKRLFGIGGHYPSLTALPDRTISWLPAAVARGLRLISQENCAVLLSSSPPSTAHCIGMVLKRLTGLPWIADLRDPWRGITPGGRWHRSLDQRLETAAMRRADAIVVTTPSLGEHLTERFGPSVGGKVTVIRNGFDEEMFARLAAPQPATRFELAHLGSLNSYREPRSLLVALRDALRHGTVPADTLIRFVGSIDAASDALLHQAAEELEVAEHVQIEPRCPQEQALAIMLQASALLLLQPSAETAPCIPTKAFEYLRSNRPVLCVAPAGSETRRFVEGFDLVFTASADDPTAIRRQIEATHVAWQQGLAAQRDVSSHSRREATAMLAGVLDRLTEHRAGV